MESNRQKPRSDGASLVVKLTGRLAVAAFTGVYLAISTALALRSGNSEFIFYVVVMLGLITLIWWVDRRLRLPMAAIWALSAWGLVHMVGGLTPIPASWPNNASVGAEAGADPAVLYNLWFIPGMLKYDEVVHAFGFGITTWICWLGIASVRQRSELSSSDGAPPSVAPTAGVLFLAACASMGLGAMNEVVEFAATKLLPGTNVGGYENTAWDLVANLAGCTIAAAVIRIRSGHSTG